MSRKSPAKSSGPRVKFSPSGGGLCATQSGFLLYCAAMRETRKNTKGRGATLNTDNRFTANQLRLDRPEDTGEDLEVMPLLRTEFIRDSARSIVTENDSPDIPFSFSVNPYRGCEHGCAYCYARPTHEYLGYSAGLDFESKILVKHDAPKLLREKLMSKSWKGEHITFSGNTDCYQPVERKLELTRQCLQVMREFNNPVAMITKNALITRDVDILQDLAKIDGALVYISITTLDDDLCSVLEPRTSRPQARLRAIQTLSEAGIRVGVNVAPVIPGLTDHEMPHILKAAREHGAQGAGFVPLRLPLAVLPIFTAWLEENRPERKDKVLSLIRDVRGGKLNDSQFGSRMRGEGPVAENIRQMFKLYTKKFGLNQEKFKLSSAHFARPGDQLSFTFGTDAE
jgi:DNA repair photolyase